MGRRPPVRFSALESAADGFPCTSKYGRVGDEGRMEGASAGEASRSDKFFPVLQCCMVTADNGIVGCGDGAGDTGDGAGRASEGMGDERCGAGSKDGGTRGDASATCSAGSAMVVMPEAGRTSGFKEHSMSPLATMAVISSSISSRLPVLLSVLSAQESAQDGASVEADLVFGSRTSIEQLLAGNT